MNWIVRIAFAFGLMLPLSCTGSSNSTSQPPDTTVPLDATASAQASDWNAGFVPKDAVDEDPEPHRVEVSLEARVADVVLDGTTHLSMWTFNGTVPGPTIRASKGDRVVVHFKNSLPEATTIHWHGVRISNAMDGNPRIQTPVPSGGTFDYDFVVPDEGTYWYHPHVNSSAQVGYGLYGAFIVEPTDAPPLGDELVLVLSDVSITEDAGTLAEGNAQGWFGDYFGREGRLVLVNGKVRPQLRARAGAPQHWRVINASRARYAKISLSDFDAWIIGGDGGRANAATKATDVVISPGERRELFVVPTKNPSESFPVNTLRFDRFHIGATGGPTPLFDIALTADTKWDGGPALPTQWPSIEPLAVPAVRSQLVEFDDVTKDGVTYLGINGKSGSEDMAMFMSHANSVELWEIRNNTTQDHPFHIHGFSFQVIDINGAAPAAREWKDTVNIPAKMKAHLAMSFDDRRGEWMVHCHILDHADMGMMGMLMLE